MARRHGHNFVQGRRGTQGVGLKKVRNPLGKGMLVAMLSVNHRGSHFKNAKFNKCPLLAHTKAKITKSKHNYTDKSKTKLRKREWPASSRPRELTTCCPS